MPPTVAGAAIVFWEVQDYGVTNKLEGVIRAWLNGSWASTGSLTTDGVRLVSYQTEIARKDGARRVVKVTTQKYSVTTSRHTMLAKSLAAKGGWTIEDY